MVLRETFSLGVILLAAGRSSRMGSPKLLLPWGATSVLGHLVAVWQQVRPAQIAIVRRPVDVALDNELARLNWGTGNQIPNPDPDGDMFSSIQYAARWPGWHDSLNHWAISLGDQPHLQPATIANLADFARLHPEKICQPSHHGHPRHPVILPTNEFAALRESASASLKQFLESRAAQVALVPLDDPGLDFDLDHPGDYEKARRLTGLS